jgi:beta-galactosidase/beta-glucuronidase
MRLHRSVHPMVHPETLISDTHICQDLAGSVLDEKRLTVRVGVGSLGLASYAPPPRAT